MGVLLCSHFIFVRFSVLKHVGKYVLFSELLNKTKLASSFYGFLLLSLFGLSFIDLLNFHLMNHNI